VSLLIRNLIRQSGIDLEITLQLGRTGSPGCAANGRGGLRRSRWRRRRCRSERV